MPLEVRVRDGRGRPWELFQFEDEERDVAADFMDGQVAAGRRVKMDMSRGAAQGGSGRHHDRHCSRRPMRAPGCCSG